jgi:hypothetical protein
MINISISRLVFFNVSLNRNVYSRGARSGATTQRIDLPNFVIAKRRD